MTDSQKDSPADGAQLESVWAEARNLIARLEGTTVQRFVVAAGDTRIEIERGAAQGAPAGGGAVQEIGGPLALGAGPGPGVAPGARGASGSFAAIGLDDRLPVLAPLVGTYYSAPTPGAKPFVEVGDVVELGQTVCIVEAMKMMNEVGAGGSGRVAEIAAQNGEPVEFEQVLMYLEPVGDT
jgi:acetyl-CoA carboxylase biotin carboxyl carrier protein